MYLRLIRWGLGFRVQVENQMDKKMENEMEAGSTSGFTESGRVSKT